MTRYDEWVTVFKEAAAAEGTWPVDTGDSRSRRCDWPDGTHITMRRNGRRLHACVELDEFYAYETYDDPIDVPNMREFLHWCHQGTTVAYPSLLMLVSALNLNATHVHYYLYGVNLVFPDGEVGTLELRDGHLHASGLRALELTQAINRNPA